MRKKKRAAGRSDGEPTLPSAGFTLPPAQEVVVAYLPVAPVAPKDQEIPPWRPSPAVPEAPVETDPSLGGADAGASTSGAQ